MEALDYVAGGEPREEGRRERTRVTTSRWTRHENRRKVWGGSITEHLPARRQVVFSCVCVCVCVCLISFKPYNYTAGESIAVPALWVVTFVLPLASIA